MYELPDVINYLNELSDTKHKPLIIFKQKVG
jgi:hypothetical protein